MSGPQVRSGLRDYKGFAQKIASSHEMAQRAINAVAISCACNGVFGQSPVLCELMFSILATAKGNCKPTFLSHLRKFGEGLAR
jgi:hypothetical protein